ncbi:hypothetical protein ACIQPQ_34645 [Streptomyces sp. NPDC091281]|uniref:hypothetical protein n=1 Tax=Streptomyces sp. NPDC091281 TaxID=3365985 RepID=UPI0038164314
MAAGGAHEGPAVNRAARAITAALIAGAGLLAAGCTETGGPHGTVTGKEHELARTTWRTVPKTKRVCTKTRNRPATLCSTVADGTRRTLVTKPECWELDLDTGAEVCVSEDTWRDTTIGDRY